MTFQVSIFVRILQSCTTFQILYAFDVGLPIRYVGSGHFKGSTKYARHDVLTMNIHNCNERAHDGPITIIHPLLDHKNTFDL